MLKDCELDEPSAEVASTVIECAAKASKSSDVSSVTTPVPPSIANRPPAESLNEKVMPLFVASASAAEAVTPASAPAAAFSASVLTTPLLSLTAPTSNSSTSLTAIVKLAVVNDKSLDVARTVI